MTVSVLHFHLHKKVGDIRISMDFRKLNDAIKHKPFPLPKILESLQQLRGFVMPQQFTQAWVAVMSHLMKLHKSCAPRHSRGASIAVSNHQWGNQEQP